LLLLLLLRVRLLGRLLVLLLLLLWVRLLIHCFRHESVRVGRMLLLLLLLLLLRASWFLADRESRMLQNLRHTKDTAPAAVLFHRV
jgi:hypothetical protein